MEHTKMDALLRESLHIHTQPRQDFLNRVKLHMLQAAPAPRARRLRLNLTAVAVCVALVMVLATSVYALSRFLQGGDVADAAGDSALAAAFREEGALGSLDVYETQEAGDYRFTLTELVHGEELTELPFLSATVTDSRMYIILAIERLDGTAMPEDSLGFLASPLIQGYSPVEYNVFSLNSAATDLLHEGILYRILQCDDITIFADKGLSLVVSEDMQFLDAIVFHEASGAFSLNPAYPKAAALFTLPIPAEYADAEKAEAYWNQRKLDADAAEQSDEGEAADALAQHHAEMSDISFWDDATLLEGSTQVLSVNAAGQYNYSYVTPAVASGGTMILASELERMMEEAGSQRILFSFGGDDTGYHTAIIMEKDENGIVRASVWEKTVQP